MSLIGDGKVGKNNMCSEKRDYLTFASAKYYILICATCVQAEGSQKERKMTKAYTDRISKKQQGHDKNLQSLGYKYTLGKMARKYRAKWR